MANYFCFMSGHILYDDKLTYDELLDAEERIKSTLQEIFTEHGGCHFDFIAQADSLLMECVLPAMDRNINRTICDTIIQRLGPGMLARFLFVDKQMNSVVVYFLGHGKWKEEALSIPAPREALSGWVVRQERKKMPTPAQKRSMSSSPAVK